MSKDGIYYVFKRFFKGKMVTITGMLTSAKILIAKITNWRFEYDGESKSRDNFENIQRYLCLSTKDTIAIVPLFDTNC